MRPIKEILALDIKQWNMTEDELMSWKVHPRALQVARLEDEVAETSARSDQYTLASRYSRVAVPLKKTLVLLRLQLKHSRPGFQPAYANYELIYKMLLTASSAFDTLVKANIGNENFPAADFLAFRNALGFYVDQVADSKVFQDWVRQNRPEHGDDILRVTKKRATFIRTFTGGNSSRIAQLLAQC